MIDVLTGDATLLEGHTIVKVNPINDSRFNEFPEKLMLLTLEDGTKAIIMGVLHDTNIFSEKILIENKDLFWEEEIEESDIKKELEIKKIEKEIEQREKAIITYNNIIAEKEAILTKLKKEVENPEEPTDPIDPTTPEDPIIPEEPIDPKIIPTK